MSRTLCPIGLLPARAARRQRSMTARYSTGGAATHCEQALRRGRRGSPETTASKSSGVCTILRRTAVCGMKSHASSDCTVPNTRVRWISWSVSLSRLRTGIGTISYERSRTLAKSTSGSQVEKPRSLPSNRVSSFSSSSTVLETSSSAAECFGMQRCFRYRWHGRRSERRTARYHSTKCDRESLATDARQSTIERDYQIGCRILEQPFFFDEDQWLPVPSSWSPNIVTGKIFRTDQSDGQALWEGVQERMGRSTVSQLSEMPIARYGEPALIRPRLGQGVFRIAVTDAYNRRCAVTRERTLPVLEAAHIIPFADGGAHAVSNGLLLRRRTSPYS